MYLWSQALGDVNIPVSPLGLIDGSIVSCNFIQINSGPNTAAKAVTAVGTTTATATLNNMAGNVTSASLTTAAGGTYTLTLTNSNIAVGDQVMVDVGNGTNSGGQPTVANVTPGAGQVVVVVQNIHGTTALNGTIIIAFVVFKN